MDELSKNLDNLYTNCKEHLIIIDNCEPTLNVLRDRIVRLKYNNEFLINPVHRERRAAFNIIGNILYECFGILDSRFEEMYARDITQVTKNEEHIMQLMKNQTSVIDATVNILKKTNAELSTQSQQINEMSEMVKTFNLRVSGTAYFTFTIMHLSNLLDQYEMQQDSMVHVITNVHEGSVITKLLSNEQLTNQFKAMKPFVDQNVRVPENGYDIIRTITTKLWKINQVLVFKISIPLVTNEKFTIYKMYPVPVRNHDTYAEIHISAPFIMAANDRQRFTFLTKHQLNECIPYTENAVLCNRPLKFFSHNKASCEWELLNHKPNITKNCSLSVTPIHDTLIELDEENHWIFVLHRKFHFSTFCNDKVTHHELTGEGILILNPNCIIKENSLILTAQRVIDNNINPIVIPKTMINIESFKTPPPTMSINHTAVITQSFKNIDQQLADIKQQQYFPTINGHDIHHYGIIYSIITLIIIISCYKTCSTKKPPTKKKRTMSLPELSRLPQNVESST